MVLGYILEWFNKNHLNLYNLLKSSKTLLKVKSPQMLYWIHLGVFLKAHLWFKFVSMCYVYYTSLESVQLVISVYNKFLNKRNIYQRWSDIYKKT